MAYRIVYGPMPKATSPGRQISLRISMMTVVFLLLFVLLVKQTWPEGTDMLRSVLLPGEPGKTETAVQTLLEDMRNGEPVGDAVTAFCRQIIENGQTSIN